MEIVGPLVKCARGQQYIVVVCDYPIRFPETSPLLTISVVAILWVFVQLCSKVGSNLVSQLKEPTAYHTQTDGLVKRWLKH